MLRKCLSQTDESDGLECKLNCFVNSSCCAGGAVVNDIEEASEDEEIERDKQTRDETDAAGEVRQKTEECSQASKDNILQSTSSSKSRFHKCFSCCSETANETSEGMALEATDVHIASECKQKVSDSQVLREHN